MLVPDSFVILSMFQGRQQDPDSGQQRTNCPDTGNETHFWGKNYFILITSFKTVCNELLTDHLNLEHIWRVVSDTIKNQSKTTELICERDLKLCLVIFIGQISNLRTATPATVSRAGILYINPGDLGWNPFVTSWIETRENQVK